MGIVALNCDHFDGIAVVAVGGDLEGDRIAAAMAAVQDSIEHKNAIDIVFDLAGCSFVTSEALEMLLAAKNRCEEMLGRFALAACDEGVEKILEITRLRNRFDIAGTVEDAMRRMRA